MQLARVELFADRLELRPKPILRLAICLELALRRGWGAYASSRSTSSFSLRGFPRDVMTSWIS